jgi:nitroreductase
MNSKQLVEAMQWRYACKKFDSSKKINKEIIDDLLQILNLTATSLGMQLMKIVVVNNLEVQQKMLQHCHNQHQVADCSHVLVLCRYNSVDETLVDDHVNRTAQIRNFDVESPRMQGFKKMVNATIAMPDEKRIQWMNNQVYIALGNLLSACAVLKIDACPMEGFVPSGIDSLLNLEALGLSSVLLCPIGYRHDEDVYANLRKVRRPIADFVVEMV